MTDPGQVEAARAEEGMDVFVTDKTGMRQGSGRIQGPH